VVLRVKIATVFRLTPLSKVVITGFNTDVEFGGVTYHIQTEDKGLETPIILSLVYDRGTILAAKRAPYDDLIEAGLDEKLLAERLRKQHKTICAAIKKGRIDELKDLSGKRKRGKTTKKFEAAARVLEAADIAVADAIDPDPIVVEPEAFQPFADDPFDELAAPIPMPKSPVAFRNEPVIENATVVDVPEPLPFEAVRIVSDLAGTDRPQTNKLSLEFIGEDVFYGGKKCYITVMVCRGSSRRVVEDAEVMVKVLGSSFRPLIFHSRTDRNGISTVALQLPSFNSGRASILVRAINQGEEVEARRAIHHGDRREID
jgi:hypothetical protein